MRVVAGNRTESGACTEYGAVENTSVQCYVGKRWLVRGKGRHVPLNHISSIRLETRRHLFAALLLMLAGALVLFVHGSIWELALGGILICGGALALWSSPRVVMYTTHGHRIVMTGFPWTVREARRFAYSVREAYQAYTGITLLVCEPGWQERRKASLELPETPLTAPLPVQGGYGAEAARRQS